MIRPCAFCGKPLPAFSHGNLRVHKECKHKYRWENDKFKHGLRRKHKYIRYVKQRNLYLVVRPFKTLEEAIKFDLEIRKQERRARVRTSSIRTH